MKITVEFMYEDTGFCRDYYQVMEIQNDKGETIKPAQLILCKQEESKDCHIWYKTTSDGTWNEPEGPIKSSAEIVTVDGDILKPASSS